MGRLPHSLQLLSCVASCHWQPLFHLHCFLSDKHQDQLDLLSSDCLFSFVVALFPPNVVFEADSAPFLCCKSVFAVDCSTRLIVCSHQTCARRQDYEKFMRALMCLDVPNGPLLRAAHPQLQKEQQLCKLRLCPGRNYHLDIIANKLL